MSSKPNITSENGPAILTDDSVFKDLIKLLSASTKQAQSVENEEDHQQIIVNADYHAELRCAVLILIAVMKCKTGPRPKQE